MLYILYVYYIYTYMYVYMYYYDFNLEELKFGLTVYWFGLTGIEIYYQLHLNHKQILSSVQFECNFVLMSNQYFWKYTSIYKYKYIRLHNL